MNPPSNNDQPMGFSKENRVVHTLTETEETLKIDAADKPTPKVVTSVNQIKAGTLFRYFKSGTLYLKMKDGSIRNVDKAIKKVLKSRKAGNSIAEIKQSLGLPEQETTINDN
jgi:hypothetical protein